MGMSIEEQEAQAELRHTFESYLRGETPSPLDLAPAPLLANWRVLVVQIKRDAEEFMFPVLFGSVTGHPEHGDIRSLRTSRLIWLDRDRGWARTWNRVYRLGERAADKIDSGSEGAGE
jgi:hypothetical protein